MIISIFLPGIGCPKDRCIYCNQEAATAETHISNKEDIKQRIEKTIADYLSNNKEIEYPIEVAFYGGNFTALDFSVQKDLIRIVQNSFEQNTGKNHNGNIRIRFSTRPDAVKKEQLLDLKLRFNLHIVEIGVQSMDDTVLHLARRNHTREDVINACKIVKDIGLTLSCHQMVGLPGSTYQTEIATAREIVRMKPELVRIHPTLILKNSELENLFNNGLYTPMDLEQAVEITEKIVSVYRDANIKVIRIGLHPSDTLSDSIIAGPWHPAFRELVEGRYLYNKASSVLSEKRGKNVKLHVAPKDETYIRGKDNCYLEDLKKGFSLSDLVVIKDPQINRGNVSVEIVD